MTVVLVMVLTSSFLVLIMVMIWKTYLLLVVSFAATIGATELAYLTSVLYKFPQGGYLSLTFAEVLMIIMFMWSDVQRRRYQYKLHHQISPQEDVIEAGATHLSLTRILGIAIFHSDHDLTPLHGIPPFFKYYLVNIPALHSVMALISSNTVPVVNIRIQDRLSFSRVGPPAMRMYRCVARCGYEDVRRGKNGHEAFEELLVKVLMEFVKANLAGVELEAEVEAIERAWEAGVVHLIREFEMVTGEGSEVWKRTLVDWGYSFLGRIVSRQSGRECLIYPIAG